MTKSRFLGTTFQTKGEELFNIRTSLYNIWTDYYTVGQYYCVIRMPKDCWQAFAAIGPNGIAYKRKGFMWLQFPTEEIHCINRGCSIYGKQIEKYFPNSVEIYTEKER